MMNSYFWKGLRLWMQGLLLLALRWAQWRTGFDPETGLSRASLPGRALAAVILLLFVIEAALCLRLPKGKRSYRNCMEPLGNKAVPALAAGSILLGPGILLSMDWSTLGIAAAAFGVAAALGMIFFVRQVRKNGAAPVLPLLPIMVYTVLFLLTVYIPEESNPVLAQYYLPVLAAALVACAFYQLAGFTCREGSVGWFVFFGDLAVPLCVASMADCGGNWGRMLVFFGFALALTQFLMVRRAEPGPEPAPKAENSSAQGTPQE